MGEVWFKNAQHDIPIKEARCLIFSVKLLATPNENPTLNRPPTPYSCISIELKTPKRDSYTSILFLELTFQIQP